MDNREPRRVRDPFQMTFGLKPRNWHLVRGRSGRALPLQARGSPAGLVHGSSGSLAGTLLAVRIPLPHGLVGPKNRTWWTRGTAIWCAACARRSWIWPERWI